MLFIHRPFSYAATMNIYYTDIQTYRQRERERDSDESPRENTTHSPQPKRWSPYPASRLINMSMLLAPSQVCFIRAEVFFESELLLTFNISMDTLREFVAESFCKELYYGPSKERGAPWRNPQRNAMPFRKAPDGRSLLDFAAAAGMRSLPLDDERLKNA